MTQHLLSLFCFQTDHRLIEVILLRQAVKTVKNVNYGALV